MACNFTVHHFCGNICRQRLWKHSCVSSHCTDSAHAYYSQLSAGEPRRCWLDCGSALHTVWSCYQTDIPSLAPGSCYVQVTLAHYDVSDHVFISYTCSHQLWQVIKTYLYIIHIFHYDFIVHRLLLVTSFLRLNQEEARQFSISTWYSTRISCV